MKSPVTKSEKVTIVDRINVADIYESYSNIGIAPIHLKDYLGDIDHVDIVKCQETGYRFYYPYTIFGDDNFYSYLQQQRKYYADWRWEHGMAFDKITAGQRVLEIGCGTGNFLDKLKKEKNVECVGLEFNETAIVQAKKKDLAVFNESIKVHASKNEGVYDVICLFQVLEHVWDVRGFLMDSVHCLKKGGLLIVGVPNNNPYLFRHDRLHALNLPPHHAGLWNEESLRVIADHFSISIKSVDIEPMMEFEYYWSVKRNYWKDNNMLLYNLSGLIPVRLNFLRNYFIRKGVKGRNIISVYIKK